MVLDTKEYKIMYIIFYKENKKVEKVLNKKPTTDILDGYEIARCENIPDYDKETEYLVATNLQEKLEIVTVWVPHETTIESNGEIITTTEMIETQIEQLYYTCDVVVVVDERKVILNRIAELKANLHTYDYVSSKLSEATARYIVSQDDTEIKALYKEYETELSQKQAWRNEINELEKQLK